MEETLCNTPDTAATSWALCCSSEGVGTAGNTADYRLCQPAAAGRNGAEAGQPLNGYCKNEEHGKVKLLKH